MEHSNEKELLEVETGRKGIVLSLEGKDSAGGESGRGILLQVLKLLKGLKQQITLYLVNLSNGQIRHFKTIYDLH